MLPERKSKTSLENVQSIGKSPQYSQVSRIKFLRCTLSLYPALEDISKSNVLHKLLQLSTVHTVISLNYDITKITRNCSYDIYY